jgi:hypothetical protein
MHLAVAVRAKNPIKSRVQERVVTWPVIEQDEKPPKGLLDKVVSDYSHLSPLRPDH